jgi:hypothetical protein
MWYRFEAGSNSIRFDFNHSAGITDIDALVTPVAAKN